MHVPNANIVNCANPYAFTGLAVKGVHIYSTCSPSLFKTQTHTHTQRNFCSPDNKCHIIVMYSGGPHHIKVAVMESQFEAAGLDMWNQILKLFMALWSQTASLFSCKQSTGSWWCISEAFHKIGILISLNPPFVDFEVLEVLFITVWWPRPALSGWDHHRCSSNSGSASIMNPGLYSQ